MAVPVKRRRTALCVILIPVLWLLTGWILWAEDLYHTNLGVELAILLSMTALICLLGQLSRSGWLGHLPLKGWMGLLLFPMLALEMTAFYRTTYGTVFEPARVLFLLLDISLLLWWQTGHIRKYARGLMAAGLFAAPFSLVSDILLTKLRPLYYEIGRTMSLTPTEKALLLSAAALMLMGVYLLCLKLLSWALRPWKPALDRMLGRFQELEPFLLALEIFALLLWHVMGYASFLSYVRSFHLVSQYLHLSLILMFLLNVCCILLLVKSAAIHEKMQIARADQRLLSAYNSELEDTMDSLHEIRHDVKNLLLTMGGFVDRSEDQQMKEFYQQNIVPFMEHALEKNDLQSKLRILRDDCLKSFLYYKILEKTAEGITVFLELSSPVALERGYSDIIRLLGIFIDNAAEEAALAEEEIRLELRDTKEGICILISNPVRPEVRRRGVVAGTSDKGLGRGNGLVIAGKIIAGYDNILLNSYFTEYGFTQSLLIAQGRRAPA
ncbi:MAG: sensor histidine kinase [Lachnospiraceae bacterium]|nr:sensor histidine kinase [Lachnospiraceae bacterium]